MAAGEMNRQQRNTPRRFFHETQRRPPTQCAKALVLQAALHAARSQGACWCACGRLPCCATCSVELSVPPFLVGSGKGWLTAEYSMLPSSTSPRKQRDRQGKVDGRSVEIQRLIGRSLRAVVSLDKLGERTLYIDCDVLEADGGTRTASINGAYVARVGLRSRCTRADLGPLNSLLRGSVAAVSVGLAETLSCWI